MDNRQPLEAGTIVGGDYRIEKVLGAGGFGITYLARDQRLENQVAIKEYFPASLAHRSGGIIVQPLASEGGADYNWGLERFLAEAQTVASLHHTNIVGVSRYFRENETAYMVLGFVEGEDLEDWLKNLDRAPTQVELDAITEPMLSALDTIHAADLVHRDVKPQNIFIRSEDQSPILLDFGAARQALGEHSRATAAFVSPGYSPSESHLNDPTDQGPWTDIYALAATLYRALVGHPPAQVLSRVSHDTYVPLARQLNNHADYRTTFLSAIDQGLRMRREDRPQSIKKWREMLFADPANVLTHVDIVDETVVEVDDEETIVLIDPPPGVITRTTSTGGQHGGDTKIDGDPPGWSRLTRWGITVGAIAIGIVGIVLIYQSFQSPTPSRSTTNTRQPVTNPLDRMGPDTQANNGSTFANDPSLRRLVTASWHSSGIQNGFWTGSTIGSKGTGVHFKCRGANDVRRDSIVELESVPTGSRPLAGSHQVIAQIGSYSTNATLNFSSANGLSNGRVVTTETTQSAGQFLNFLHQVFIGTNMTLSIPSIGYQEIVNLTGAEESLRPCFGADIAQPWRAYKSQLRISGGEVRNANGAVLIVRCDTTSGTRGNSIVVFSTPYSGAAVSADQSVTVSLNDDSFSSVFRLTTRFNNLRGLLYHRATNDETRQTIRTFLERLRQSNSFSVSSNNPNFSESFSLRGSSAALAGCSGI